ncbi:MAG: hypothetical protein QXE06_08185 [Candidatus Bathyarchaeia archaeon]
MNIEDFEIFRGFLRVSKWVRGELPKMRQQITKLVSIDLEKAKKVAGSQDVRVELQDVKADVKSDVWSWNPDKIKMGEGSRSQG